MKYDKIVMPLNKKPSKRKYVHYKDNAEFLWIILTLVLERKCCIVKWTK